LWLCWEEEKKHCNNMSKFLHIENLTCGYENKFHIKSIDFYLAKGEFTGIIGPNGSGKTTLFRGISGEIKVKTGKIMLEGKDIRGMGYKEKACNIAIVAQNTETAAISVFDYVLMGRIPYHNQFSFFENKADFELAEKYMKLTDVWHLKDKQMNQLSGGEQQLASIARALAQEPKVLLLDEPTAHLDIFHQLQILNLIQRLVDQLGLTVLMIIHDLNLASEYCDFLVMMNEGTIFTKGEANKVLTYQHIEEVYKTVAITKTNPLSGKPAIFLVSEKVLEEKKSNRNE
jgi:iron complex transport system ATP-binding protein